MYKLNLNGETLNITGAKGRVIYATTRDTQDEFSDRNWNIENIVEQGGTVLLDGYTIQLEESDKVQYEYNPDTKVFVMRTNDWSRMANFMGWVKQTLETSEQVHEYIDF